MVKKAEPCTDARYGKIENIDLFQAQPEPLAEREVCCFTPAAVLAVQPV